MESPSILSEVRDFLASLKGDLPELYRPPAPADPASPERVFFERVAHWGARMGLAASSIRVKDQRTLWGSCSPRGRLNFNWRLTLAPPEVLDYVVIHELAHLREMNHSPRFWAVVSEHCPEHKERRRWLRENGRELYSARRRRSAGASSGESPESHSPSG